MGFRDYFRKASTKALTVIDTVHSSSNNSNTWAGFDITQRDNVEWKTIRIKNHYLSRDSKRQGEVDELPRTNRDYREKGVLFGRYYYMPAQDPLQAATVYLDDDLLLGFAAQVEYVRDVTEYGVRGVDCYEISYDRCYLDKDAIKKVINHLRDEAIFDEVRSNEERGLFQFRKTSEIPLLSGPENYKSKPVRVTYRRWYSRDEHFDNISQLLNKLRDDDRYAREFFNSDDIIVYGIDKINEEKKQLPSEFLYRLKRQVVLQRLETGPKKRLLQVEKKLQDAIARTILKIPRQDGADESGQTVKAQYLWMSIVDERVRGTVVLGTFKDRDLSSMSRNELKALQKECCDDETSKILLEAYFAHIDFEDHRKKKDWHRTGAQNENGAMDLKNACDTLGLELPDDGIIRKSDIQSAFRDKARAFHGDQNRTSMSEEEASTADARMADINTARDFLFEHFGYQ